MKKIGSSKRNCGNVAKMTLKDYYANLPDATYPKTSFINELCRRCNISSATAHNWVKFKTRPLDNSHISVLSELTGIAPSELFG